MSDLTEFLEELSSAKPVPGGGSVAALQCALGASLLIMVANLTLGRKKYADAESRVLEIRAEAERLRDRATRLADEDAEAYGQVAGVLAMPRETDAQKAARRESMEAALKGAVEPPLATMAVAQDVLDLAADLMVIGNRSAISDVGTAAGAARAGYDAALLNVEINLASISDMEWTQSVRAKFDSFLSSRRPGRHDRRVRSCGDSETIVVTAEILDGRKISALVLESVKQRVEGLQESGIHPTLCFVTIGESEPALMYVSRLEKLAARVGISICGNHSLSTCRWAISTAKLRCSMPTPPWMGSWCRCRSRPT